MTRTIYTNSELRIIAKKYGFIREEKEKHHGQLVFSDKKRKYFITHDIDQHNGGMWKKATTIDRLSSRRTRLGTYDIDAITRIGD